MRQTGDETGSGRRVAQRVKDIKPFYVMDVLEKAQAMERAGQDVVHLEVGEPDFDAPEPVKEAVAKAIRDGHTHYTHSLGLAELREAICEHYLERYGVTLHPDQVVVTNGTSPAMLMLFAALLEPGDQVILSDPHYACYPSFIRFADGEPVLVRVQEEDGFQYRVEAVEAALTPRTRAVLVNSPGNPTGTLLPAERMAGLVNLTDITNLANGGVPIVSDEIYHGLVYGEPGQSPAEAGEHSVLEFTDEAFVLNGFSKLYAMTGLRLGYLIAPRGWTEALRKLSQNFFISANAVSQWAGVAALRECAQDVARMRAVYDQRRRAMLAGLRAMGLSVVVEPTGAFYVFVNISRYSTDAYAFAFEILEQTRVGVTPGTDFGPGGEGHIRFSYANSLENIERGLARIAEYLARRG